jgi:hypothetical protein
MNADKIEKIKPSIDKFITELDTITETMGITTII